MKKQIFKIKQVLVLSLVVSSFGLSAQEVTGTWKGTLNIQGTEMPLTFNVEEANGEYSSTMDSPSQGAMGIPMDETLFADKQLTIVFKQAGIKYVGTLNENNISGTFYQGTMELPLNLEKSEKTLPGNPDLVTSEEELNKLASYDTGNYLYSVEDYFAKPKASEFRFSPDGKYLSYKEKDENGKRHVYVKEVSTGKVSRAIEE